MAFPNMKKNRKKKGSIRLEDDEVERGQEPGPSATTTTTTPAAPAADVTSPPLSVMLSSASSTPNNNNNNNSSNSNSSSTSPTNRNGGTLSRDNSEDAQSFVSDLTGVSYSPSRAGANAAGVNSSPSRRVVAKSLLSGDAMGVAMVGTMPSRLTEGDEDEESESESGGSESFGGGFGSGINESLTNTTSQTFHSAALLNIASSKDEVHRKSLFDQLNHNDMDDDFDDDEDNPQLQSSTTSRGNKLLIDFLQDNPRETNMTWSRRFALYLIQYKWYYPPRFYEEEEENEANESSEGAAAAGAVSSSSLSNAAAEDPTEWAGNASGNVHRTTTSSRSNSNSNRRSTTTTTTTTIRGEPDYTRLSTFYLLNNLSSQQREAYPFTHSKREAPCLKKAWAYFEHVALPRYLIDQDKPNKPKKNICLRMIRRVFCKGNQKLSKSEPGERELPTKLYHPLFTPHAQLGDFGLGIGLYFSTLRFIFLLTFLAGLLNIPNLIYYSGEEYSNSQVGVPDLLKGSAICTDTIWVPCPTCNTSTFETNRLATTITTNTIGLDTNLTFALLNNCDGATFEQGMINYGTMFLIIVGIFVLNRYLKKSTIAFDEDEQTAQDYSIVIQNPPGDATDPEEWRLYFQSAFKAHVTTCTVGVDNDLLVRYLVERRELLRKVEMQLEPGTQLDKLTLAGLSAAEERQRKWYHWILAKTIAPGLPETFSKIVVLTAKLQGLAQQEYPASNVFVTFEKEADQRKVLASLNYAPVDVWSNRKGAASNGSHLFRGTRLLHVSEPDEPNTIRWQDLNEKWIDRIKQQFLTLVVTIGSIALIAFIISLTNDNSVAATSFVIAIFNTIFPLFAKALNGLESHSSEGGKQRSLYCKIALFRWVNTAIVITIITPFTDTLRNDGGMIQQIYSLFFAEIITTNAIQLADPVGHLKRHFLAPRANTQDSMNLAFSGSDMELAERYTNMTKILFLALWYCAIYPSAFFMCSFALLINYYVDRFSLMRTWKRLPNLGTEISEFSRRFFFSIAIVAMALICSYYWSAFPYDNLCAMNTTVSSEYVGNWFVQPLDKITTTETNTTTTTAAAAAETTTVQPSDTDFQFCLQDYFRYPLEVNSFPFIAAWQPEGREWMTAEQERLANIYGWTALAIIVLVFVSFCWMLVKSFIRLFWHSKYKAVGDDMGINFSDVPNICTYIPSVESPVFAYPLLACNVDRIDKSLLEWTDPDRPFAFYDLTKDAECLTNGVVNLKQKVVFSQVAHWPPVVSEGNGIGDNDEDEEDMATT